PARPGRGHDGVCKGVKSGGTRRGKAVQPWRTAASSGLRSRRYGVAARPGTDAVYSAGRRNSPDTGAFPTPAHQGTAGYGGSGRVGRINPRVVKVKLSKCKKQRPEHRPVPLLTKTFIESVVMVR